MPRILSEFKHAVESRAIDAFWDSRISGRLRSKPEKIGQALLAVFAKGVLGGNGIVLREVSSGIGFVDIGMVFSGTLHLIEMKVLKNSLKGDLQLAAYMKAERRSLGWLVLLDVRDAENPAPIPSQINVPEGRIKTLVIEINPAAPSRKMP